MRWIFFSLVFFNMIAFAWGLVARSPADAVKRISAVSRHNPYERYPQLVLLAENSRRDIPLAEAAIERSPLASPDQEQASVRTGGEEASSAAPLEELPVREQDGRALCDIVGPFDAREVAEVYVQRFADIEVKSEVRDLDLPIGLGYWVYLPPLGSRKEALQMLRDLQSRRIDSYVVPKGEQENAVSLGMFSKKALADARVAEVVALGLVPRVDEIERTQRELWVVLSPGEESKISSLTWDKILADAKSLERRQNYCLDVASQ